MGRANDDQPSTSEGTSKVVYIGHLPHGFYEQQLRGYFDQFGKVAKVRVSRNKKTTRSRGCAWLQFSHAEVARIAAEAMNGYMLFGHTIRCHVLKPQEVHAALFKHANTKMKRKPWAKIEAERHNKDRSPEERALRVERLIKKDDRRQAKIKASGIGYEYEALRNLLPKRSKRITFS